MNNELDGNELDGNELDGNELDGNELDGSKLDDSGDASPRDLEARLEKLSPLMNLLDQARDAIASPLSRTDAPSRSHLDMEPPATLGDFELMSPIGRGGMGVVYEARQRSLDRIVAIKVLPKSILPDTAMASDVEPTSQQNLVKRFHVEARAAARLHHTNIVPVYGFGEDAGFYFFVMQRIYGLSLDKWIEVHFASDNENRMQQHELAKTAAKFGGQAASALAYAHTEGILHRDVKPANLLIDEDNNLQVADFGIAQMDDANALTKTKDVVGTLRYMAPEQISGESTARSDVYSLGVTLYELVTGTPALDDVSVRNALLLQKTPPGPKPLSKLQPNLPIDLRTIIEKAMMPIPADRYGSAIELAKDLDRFLGNRPIAARRMPWWERSSRWVRNNQAVSTLTSLLFLALAMAAIISILGQISISKSLDKKEIAKRSAEKTAGIATKAMDKVFSRFSSSAEASNVVLGATDFSAPAVDPKTATLLEELLGYYDDLSAETSSLDSPVQRLATGQTKMNVGIIYQQLGEHAAAVEAFENAFENFDTLDPLAAARAQNHIGIVQQLMGHNEASKPHHQKALALLTKSELSETEPAVRFEICRSQYLSTRRLRPGMGPHQFPPAESFIFDPWRGQMPDGYQTRQRRASNSDSLEFLESVEQMVQLDDEMPDSISVKLMLTTMVREALGDGLVARSKPEKNQRLLELADRMERELISAVQRLKGSGNDAAARYELVRLLTDFNVFRQLEERDVQRGLELLERALPHVEYLAEYFPNVPAYENLAIHTWYKAATLRSRRIGTASVVNEYTIRPVRSLLRDTIQHQQHLLKRNPDADGYALWCSLFRMRIGDTHFRLGDDLVAFRAYRRALRNFPIDAPLTKTDVPEDEEWGQLRVALPILLDRFAGVLQFLSPESGEEALAISDYVEETAEIDWLSVQIALDSLVESASL